MQETPQRPKCHVPVTETSTFFQRREFLPHLSLFLESSLKSSVPSTSLSLFDNRNFALIFLKNPFVEEVLVPVVDDKCPCFAELLLEDE